LSRLDTFPAKGCSAYRSSPVVRLGKTGSLTALKLDIPRIQTNPSHEDRFGLYDSASVAAKNPLLRGRVRSRGVLVEDYHLCCQLPGKRTSSVVKSASLSGILRLPEPHCTILRQAVPQEPLTEVLLSATCIVLLLVSLPARLHINTTTGIA
jgi:hypothetical protein